MLAVCSEYAFGWSSLPRRDWRLFKRPLLSTLLSSLHTWLLLRVQTACSSQESQTRRRRSPNPAAITAEDNIPSMNGPRRILQQFLNPAAQP